MPDWEAYYLVSKRLYHHIHIFLVELYFFAKLEKSNGAVGVFYEIADRLWFLAHQDLKVNCQLLMMHITRKRLDIRTSNKVRQRMAPRVVSSVACFRSEMALLVHCKAWEYSRHAAIRMG